MNIIPRFGSFLVFTDEEFHFFRKHAFALATHRKLPRKVKKKMKKLNAKRDDHNLMCLIHEAMKANGGWE